MKKRILFVIFICLLLITSCGKIEEPLIQITYTGLGAQKTVSGSMHMLKVGNDIYLIDAGAFYGNEGENNLFLMNDDIKKIKAIFITHAHADHIGRLPILFDAGYKGPVYMTPVTKEIALINLISGIKYSDFGLEEFYYSKNNKSKQTPVYLEKFSYGQYEVKKENRIYIKMKRNELEENNFYLSPSTIEHLTKEIENDLNKQVVLINIDTLTTINDNVEVIFKYTSHLPGSAMTLFNIHGKKILFSGDIGGDNSPFLPHNSPISEELDYLFIEGTYGVENRGMDTTIEREKLRKYIGNAIRANERVVIPAFAIDRTQQVLYEIRLGMEQGLIPKETIVKAFSPTSEEITKLYLKYAENQPKLELYFTEKMDKDIFNIENLIYNPRLTNKMYDLNIGYGEIGVMTSGMMSNAFSLDVADAYISDNRTHFIFVGYQDSEELGGQITAGENMVIIGGKEHPILANIFTSAAFSGHADVKKIYELFADTNPNKIFIIHLNQNSSDELKSYYEQNFPNSIVIVPEIKQSFILNNN